MSIIATTHGTVQREEGRDDSDFDLPSDTLRQFLPSGFITLASWGLEIPKERVQSDKGNSKNLCKVALVTPVTLASLCLEARRQDKSPAATKSFDFCKVTAELHGIYLC